jgi:glycosyltransferase involved in cell wall biosynthesis
LDRPQSQNHEAKQRWIESYLGRSVSRRVDGIIVHGNTAKQILETRWGPQTSHRIHAIPHGHYIHSYKNNISREAARAYFGFDASNLVFAFLGQIRPYKGVVLMVKAFKACADPNARLIIAAGQSMSQSRKRSHSPLTETCASNSCQAMLPRRRSPSPECLPCVCSSIPTRSHVRGCGLGDVVRKAVYCAAYRLRYRHTKGGRRVFF